MPVLSVHNLDMSFAERTLFKNVSFDMEKGDKIGIIGANGVGKTTLFKIISGELSPDNGNVFKSSDINLGYMQQHACSTPNRTVYEELLSVFDYLIDMEKEIEEINHYISLISQPDTKDIEKQTTLIETFEKLGGLTYKNRTKSALIGFGFDEEYFNMPTGQLSGGQRSKLSLLKLLLSKSNFLLLDEPTNHLDIKSVNWLESFIKDFKGSMLIISHDRYFLDNVTNKTMELEHNKIMMYKGNYTLFKEKKKAYLESLKNKYENDLKEIKRIEGIVEQQKRWNQAHNFVTAASKQKEADRIKAQLVAPDGEIEKVKMRFNPRRISGNDVVMCSNLSKKFDNNKLFENVNLHIKKGEKVFIIGKNGCGKTTLFKMLMGKISADSGTIDFGSQVDIGYFDQMQSNLDLNKNALDEVWDSFPNMTETQIRTGLGSFLIKGDDVFKPLNKMSGGERARVSLLKLMLQGSNLLFLDEPTNHLDSNSREQLEKTLSDYDGTMVIISHDRYFINKLSSRILELKETGFVEYLGNYDYYLEKTSQPANNIKTNDNSSKKQKPMNDYQLEKLERAKERKRKNDLRKIEEQIEIIEQEITEINEKLQTDEVIADYEKVMELTDLLEEKQTLYDELMELWEELCE